MSEGWEGRVRVRGGGVRAECESWGTYHDVEVNLARSEGGVQGKRNPNKK